MLILHAPLITCAAIVYEFVLSDFFLISFFCLFVVFSHLVSFLILCVFFSRERKKERLFGEGGWRRSGRRS